MHAGNAEDHQDLIEGNCAQTNQKDVCQDGLSRVLYRVAEGRRLKSKKLFLEGYSIACIPMSAPLSVIWIAATIKTSQSETDVG